MMQTQRRRVARFGALAGAALIIGPGALRVAQARAGGVAGEVCAQATLINCNDPGGYDFDNTKTTGGWDEINLNDPNQNFCIGGSSTNRNTYWFKFVASDTSAQVHTCDSVGTDSSMQLYAGACGGLVEFGCAEDNCGASSFNSYIYAEGLTVGATYYVQVGSFYAGAAGQYNLKVMCPEADCATCGLGPHVMADNDGMCADVDFVQSGNPADTPSVPPGGNNNYGCIWPDVGVGPGGSESDPDRFQALGPILNLEICGTTFMSQRSDASPDTYFRDFDWYTFESPIDTSNGAFETLVYELHANVQKGLFVLQLGADNARGCVQAPPGVDDDVYYVGTNFFPWQSSSGGVGDCNVHNVNSVLLPDGETFNLVIRPTRDMDGAGLCSEQVVGHAYVVSLGFVGPSVGGACCLPDDTCVEVAEVDCQGVYRGDDTYCAGNPNGVNTTGLTEAPSCPAPLPCPPGGMIEGLGLEEIIGFQDVINVGCNAPSDPGTGQVVPLAPDIVSLGDIWCGSTGNFQNNGRDLDWYRFPLDGDAEVTITLDAQAPMVLFLIETFDGNYVECEGETVVGSGATTEENGTIVLTKTLCAGDYYIVPAVNGFSGYPIIPGTIENWEYVFSVTGAPVLQEIGACCLPDTSCIETDPCNCRDLEGWYYGEASACADANVKCCAEVCLSGDTPEGEPACFLGYQDFYNSGCGAMGYADFQTNDYYLANDPQPGPGTPEIDPFIDAVLGQVFCGTIGEFVTDTRLRDGTLWPNEEVRDEDWYRIQHPGGVVYASVRGELFQPQVFLTFESAPLGDLCNYEVNPVIPEVYSINKGNQIALSCETRVLDFGDQPAGLYYLTVAPVNTVFGAAFSCADPREYRFAYGVALCECPNVDDTDGLGVVDLVDLQAVLFFFGQGVPAGTNGDANCDGVVGLDDLSEVLFAFGTMPGC